MLHRFKTSIANIPLPERFTYPFCYTPHPLCVMAAEEVQHYLNRQHEWKEELSQGGRCSECWWCRPEMGRLVTWPRFRAYWRGRTNTPTSFRPYMTCCNRKVSLKSKRKISPPSTGAQAIGRGQGIHFFVVRAHPDPPTSPGSTGHSQTTIKRSEREKRIA